MTMRDLIPWTRQSAAAPAAYRGRESDPVLGFRREVERLFDDFFRGGLPGFGGVRGGAWPSLELGETDREVRVTAEVPGLGERDIELFVEDGALTLRGERKSETEEHGYSERFYGRFERRIGLPANVDEAQARAEFRDGVLTVILPKTAEAARGRRIPINGDTRH